MEDIIAAVVMMVVVLSLIPLYFWRRRLDSRLPHQHQEEAQVGIAPFQFAVFPSCYIEFIQSLIVKVLELNGLWRFRV